MSRLLIAARPSHLLSFLPISLVRSSLFPMLLFLFLSVYVVLSSLFPVLLFLFLSLFLSFPLPFSLCCSSSFSLYTLVPDLSSSFSVLHSPSLSLPALWFPISLPLSQYCTPLLFLSLHSNLETSALPLSLASGSRSSSLLCQASTHVSFSISLACGVPWDITISLLPFILTSLTGLAWVPIQGGIWHGDQIRCRAKCMCASGH